MLSAVFALLVPVGAQVQHAKIETDLTASFSSLTDVSSWTGATGYTATNFCPMVEVGGGIGQKQVCERYNNNCTATGNVFYATVSGLAAGTYKIELYGGAAFTFGRGFGSIAFTGNLTTATSTAYKAGDHIDTETGVTLYAESEGVTYGGEIPIYYATDFPDGAATVTLNDVVVGESGTIKIGMSKTSQSTNWHVIQLKSVIATVDAYALYQLSLNAAMAIDQDSPMNADVKSRLLDGIDYYGDLDEEQTAETYQTAITELDETAAAARTSIANYAVALPYAHPDLDEAGVNSYKENETVAALIAAYDSKSLLAISAEQIAACEAQLPVATRAQTTAPTTWTAVLTNPGFESGDFTGWTNNGMAVQGNDSFEKVGSKYCEKWQPNGTFGVSQTVTLPTGVWALSAKIKARGVTSAKLYANGIEKAVTVGEETDVFTVDFACDENADVLFGFEGVGTGAGSSWLCVDDFQLVRSSLTLPDVTAVEGKMNVAVGQAQLEAINTYNVNRTVANYNAAMAAIAAAEASIAAYESAATTLQAMSDFTETTNFYTPEALNTYYTQWEEKYGDGTLTNEEANALQNPNAIIGWRVSNTVDDLLMSAFDEETEQWGTYHINTWSTEGNTDGTGFTVPFYEYWTGDGGVLAEKTITATLTNMTPEAEYNVSALVRVRHTNDKEIVAGSITLQVGEGEAVDVTAGESVTETQFYLGSFTATGVADAEGRLVVKFNVAAESNISWLSFKNLVYAKVEPKTDYTDYIVNADLSDATSTAWSTEGTKGYHSVGGVVTCGNNAIYDFSQTVQNLPAGQYKLTAQANYRYSGSEADEYAAIMDGANTKFAKLYATVGEKTVETLVMNRYDGSSETDLANGNGSVMVNMRYVPNSTSAVKAWFAAGEYVNEVVFNLPADGDVTIGIKKTESPDAGDYTVIGPWTLTRLGDAIPEYAINVAEAENGSIEVKATAVADEEISVNIVPADGYVIDEAYYTVGESTDHVEFENIDEETNTATFTMPENYVTIYITFKEAVVPTPAYTFEATEWVAGDQNRISPQNVTIANGSIVVDKEGDNNVALLFDGKAYIVAANLRYFAIKATGLSTEDGKSYLWWLNNHNNGKEYAPDYIFEEDGETVFAWDLATCPIAYGLGSEETVFEKNSQWSTTFGMTLAEGASYATISYIGFIESVVEYAYAFVASEWPAGDAGRISAQNVSVNETDNTITVVNTTGANNVALNFKSNKKYYVEDIEYFAIKATGISTAVGASRLWWLNAKNDGGEYAPSTVGEDENGAVVLLWRVSECSGLSEAFNSEGTTYLDGNGASTWGWTTTFGLTMDENATSVVFSYIGYATANDNIVTGISTVEAEETEGEGLKDGKYFVNGEIIIVKNGKKYNTAGQQK